MGKIVTNTIKRFDSGVQSDIRSPRNGAQMVKNFDIITHTSSLKPTPNSEEGNDTQEREIQRFNFVGSTLYGLGVDEGTAFAQIYTKTDFTAGAWNTPTNSTSTSGATSFELFAPYKYGGNLYFYGAKAGSTIWRSIVGTSFTESYQSLTYTTIRQGLVHSKDDVLYIPYDNKIAKDNAGSWTAAALTLPSYLSIESICEFGNYLAILASDSRRSFVYLWDRDSSLTTLSDSIDIGYGYYQIMEEHEGTLVVIGEVGKMLVIKHYVGAAGFANLFELPTTGGDPLYASHKQKTRDRIYFAATLTIDGTAQQGVWAFGRSREGELCLSLEATANNDTAA